MADRNKLSAILVSWKRVPNLSRIVEQLNASPLIAEILLWNNDPEITLAFPAVTVINSPRNYGCLARYCLAPMAANRTIWFQDDDIVIRPDQLQQIHSAYLQDPLRIYGATGRNIVHGLYSADPVHGNCDVVLGQTMMFDRALLHHAFEPLGSLPPNIAEDDIVFSLACRRRHFAVEVGPIETPGWDDESALWKQPGHFDRRQRAVEFMLAWQKWA